MPVVPFSFLSRHAAVVPVPAPAPAGVRMPGYKNKEVGQRKRVRAAGMTALFLVSFVYAFLLLILPRQLLIIFSLPLAVLFLLILWALPKTSVEPGKAMARLFWVAFGSFFLWPNYLAVVIPGLPWITVVRLTCFPLAILILLYLSRSSAFTAELLARLKGSRAILSLVTAFGVLLLISIVFSSVPIETVNRVIDHQLTWTLMFFAAVWVLKDENAIARWATVFIALTCVLCIMAVFEARAGHVLWAKSIPSFIHLDDSYAQEVLGGFYRLDGSYRVITTATTPLSFGELLALSVPFVLFLADWKRTPRILAATFAMEGLIVYGLIEADARLGFVGLILSHAVYFTLYALSQRRERPHDLLANTMVYVIPAAVGTIALAVLTIGRLRVHVLGSGQHQYSDDARMDQWAMGMDRFIDRPIFGYGSDQAAQILGFVTPGGKLTIDSYYLSILLDFGLVGVVVFYGVMIYAMVRTLKIALRRRDLIGKLATALTAFMAANLVIKAVLSQQANQPLLFIALGAVVVLCGRDRETRNSAGDAVLSGEPLTERHSRLLNKAIDSR